MSATAALWLAILVVTAAMSITRPAWVRVPAEHLPTDAPELPTLLRPPPRQQFATRLVIPRRVVAAVPLQAEPLLRVPEACPRQSSAGVDCRP